MGIGSIIEVGWAADVCMWGLLPWRRLAGGPHLQETVQHHPAGDLPPGATWRQEERDLGPGWQRVRGLVVLSESSLTSLVSLLNFRFWMVLLAWTLFSNLIICF